MKTKTLLLTLMVLTMWSCSNDDNNPAEEQEEMTEYKIKKVSLTHDDSWSQEMLFDEEGRLTVMADVFNYGEINDYVAYKYTYNSDNQIVLRNRYVNDEFGEEDITFVYDNLGRLSEVHSFNGTQTFLYLTFTYNGNTIEVSNTMTPHSFTTYYTIDANDKITKKSVYDFNVNMTLVYDYIYSGDNLTEIIFSYEDCADCEVINTTITYDNNPNPIFENFGNMFYYYTLGNPFTEGSRRHYSPNNLLSYTTDTTNFPINYTSELEYNEAGYPILMKEFKNGNQMNVITFEYYE